MFTYFRDTTLGWALSVLLRVVNVPDPVDFAVYVAYTNGNVENTLQFGTRPDGDPIVWLSGFPTPLALEGLGSGYHWYRLQYDAASQKTDLYVDGVARLSDHIINSAVTTPHFGWGAGGGPGTGQGNFADVRFEIVPEPGTATTTCVLLLLGGLLSRKLRRFLSEQEHN